jgi:hypothetical protein
MDELEIRELFAHLSGLGSAAMIIMLLLLINIALGVTIVIML